MPEPVLAGRLALVRAEIAERQRAAELTQSVRIVAVTKTHGADAVVAAAEAGLTDVGENRVQEALEKQDEARGVAVDWHLIGSLQRNKVRQIVGRFALIHSVDRVDLAEEIDRRTPDGAVQDILLQVNCSAEEQKGGVEPAALESLLEALRPLAKLNVRGLMTMTAFDDDELEQRRTFAMLRTLRDAMERQGHALPELSMGMSGDYPAAVAEGSTMVRLGTVLFGARD